MPSPMEYAEQYVDEEDWAALLGHYNKLKSRMSAASVPTQEIYQEVLDFCEEHMPDDDDAVPAQEPSAEPEE